MSGETTALREVERELSNLVNKVLSSHGSINKLSDIGISSTRDGLLSVDNAKLDKVLASDAGAVEVRVRLVEQVNRCILQEHAREREALPLTCRELADRGVEEVLGRRGASQANTIERRAHAIVGDVVIDAAERMAHRRIRLSEVGPLREVGHALTKHLQVDRREVRTADTDGPSLRRPQAEQDA